MSACRPPIWHLSSRGKLMLKRYMILSAGLHTVLVSGLFLSSSGVKISFDVRRGLSALKVEVVENKPHKKKTPRVQSREFTVLVAPGGSFVIDSPREKKKQKAAQDKRHNKTLGALSKRAALNSKNSPPAYPEVAKTIGYQGEVIISIEVLPTGKTGSVRVLQSSGVPMLDESAVRAARRWTFFEPGEFHLTGSMRIKQKIIFKLK